MSDLRTAVEKTIKDYVAAKGDGKFCIHDWYGLLANILGTSQQAVEGAGGNDAEFNALVSDVEWAVTTYFVPLDLPFAGATLEVFIDRQAVAAIRPAMEFLRPAPHANH